MDNYQRQIFFIASALVFYFMPIIRKPFRTEFRTASVVALMLSLTAIFLAVALLSGNILAGLVIANGLSFLFLFGLLATYNSTEMSSKKKAVIDVLAAKMLPIYVCILIGWLLYKYFVASQVLTLSIWMVDEIVLEPQAIIILLGILIIWTVVQCTIYVRSSESSLINII